MKRLRTYNSANAWLSAEMVGNYSWIHQFSAPEIAELELAAIKVLDNEIIIKVKSIFLKLDLDFFTPPDV